MDSRKMKVIPAPSPGTRSVLRLGPGSTPLFSGNGSRSYRCGTCDRTIHRNIGYAQVKDVVVECSCGSFNEIPSADQTN